MEYFEAATKHGLGIVLALIVGLLVYKIVMFLLNKVVTHILEQQSLIMKMAIEQNEKWQRVVDDVSNKIQKLDEVSATAHGYQREEHKEMVKNLTEMTVTLGRINGYKG